VADELLAPSLDLSYLIFQHDFGYLWCSIYDVSHGASIGTGEVASAVAHLYGINGGPFGFIGSSEVLITDIMDYHPTHAVVRQRNQPPLLKVVQQ